jgi:hypothetical protein
MCTDRQILLNPDSIMIKTEVSLRRSVLLTSPTGPRLARTNAVGADEPINVLSAS